MSFGVTKENLLRNQGVFLFLANTPESSEKAKRISEILFSTGQPFNFTVQIQFETPQKGRDLARDLQEIAPELLCMISED